MSNLLPPTEQERAFSLLIDNGAKLRCQCGETVSLEFISFNEVSLAGAEGWVFDGEKWLCVECAKNRDEVQL